MLEESGIKARIPWGIKSLGRARILHFAEREMQGAGRPRRNVLAIYRNWKIKADSACQGFARIGEIVDDCLTVKN
jgi:hypothetical protein